MAESACVQRRRNKLQHASATLVPWPPRLNTSARHVQTLSFVQTQTTANRPSRLRKNRTALEETESWLHAKPVLSMPLVAARTTTTAVHIQIQITRVKFSLTKERDRQIRATPDWIRDTSSSRK